MINDQTQLFTLMRSGAVVITPNNRLSNQLQNAFFAAHSQKVQDKPRCLPYSAFLQDQFKKLCYNVSQLNHPLVLSPQQLNYLWHRIFSNFTHDVFNEGLLQAVEEAWNRCHLWQIDFCHSQFSQTPQTRQFQRWALQLQEEMNKLGVITEAQLADYLLSSPHYLPMDSLIWACFDDYTPQQQALQQHFNKHGYEIYHYDLNQQASNLFCYAAKDDTDEYQQLIYWLKEHLAQDEKRIAVVVPNLQSQSQRLQRLLEQALPPSAQFNISLGKALADYPLVAHALCWLALDTKTLSSDQARLLLHSPYIAYSQTEMLARSQFMEESTVLQEPYFSQTSFIEELKGTAPQLAQLVQEMTPYPEKYSPRGWLTAFKNRLLALGFPGEYPLSSASYQCYQRFLALFDEFRQLTLVTSKMTKAQALCALKNSAKLTVFQPQKSEADIQILGLLEAAGCTFDCLWVTGLTDECLPQKTRLSAFIPISLQRDNLMPHACPERELQLAQKAVWRLSNSSPHLVFSYSRLSADKPNMISPLIANLPSFPAYDIHPKITPSALIQWIENYQIPFAEDEHVAGGTAILANQAKCPFRAFATHRLRAKAAPEISDGPDSKERGQLIHTVMELLWQILKNQETLLALTAHQLDQSVEQAIQQALEPLIKQRAHTFSEIIQAVELARLKRLVHACLQWERQRPPFKIEALEQAFNINLAGIDFRVRVDRLDCIEQGKKWVIDYKSSLPQSLPWKEERPQEPQLLLYALLDETINGLWFAQLRSGQLIFKGLSEEKYPLTGLTALKKDENWAEYRQRWQAQLTELAEEFKQGHCPPLPASSSICQQCDFQNLCRFEAQ